MKCVLTVLMVIKRRRSREGAWIEICGQCLGCRLDKGRSREGAWIEISNSAADYNVKLVAPARERGLKCLSNGTSCCPAVAPARERGLKF